LFVVLPFEQYTAALILFIAAATTDWVDGYWARKYNLVTQLGRIFDPFVDKILICGTFIYLAAIPGSGLLPWMTVVIVGRELLVTVLRSYLEQQGADFSAKMSGKLKMVLQCVAAAASLLVLEIIRRGNPVPAWLDWLLWGGVVSAIVLTIYSGVVYIVAAARLLGPQNAPPS